MEASFADDPTTHIAYAVPMPAPPDTFVQQLESLGIVLEPGEPEKLATFLDLLLEANTRFNLTAITDRDEAWQRHIFDSLTLMPFLGQAGAKRVIDIGSGGGMPGIPLAIVMPSVAFTLVEATGKKAEFLREAAERLALTNVAVINERAETIGQDHKAHREQYDAVIARAVGKLSVLLELTVAFAKVGGHVLAIKGERAQDEIAEAKRALHTLHCEVVNTHRTPTGTIVVIEKLRNTPRMYPRRPGEPKRSPL
jgi:16S rRNA (guanine527-N7)-methyltransferase